MSKKDDDLIISESDIRKFLKAAHQYGYNRSEHPSISAGCVLATGSNLLSHGASKLSRGIDIDYNAPDLAARIETFFIDPEIEAFLECFHTRGDASGLVLYSPFMPGFRTAQLISQTGVRTFVTHKEANNLAIQQYPGWDKKYKLSHYILKKSEKEIIEFSGILGDRTRMRLFAQDYFI